MLDEVGTVAGQHVDNRNLDHGVTAGLQAHRGTGYIDQYLSGEGWVVDLHVELEALVLSLSADALAYEVYAVAHVANIVNAGYLEYVGFVAGEVGVCLDGCCHLVELSTVFQLYIYHAAVDAFAQGDMRDL